MVELSEKLKEAQRQRQANETLRKSLTDKEADLRERENEIEVKRKQFDQKELFKKIEKLQQKYEAESSERKKAEDSRQELEERVQNVCEKNKSLAHDLKEANSKLAKMMEELKEKEERIKEIEEERNEAENKRKRLERDLDELKRMESEGGSEEGETQLTPKGKEKAKLEKLESKVASLKQVVAQKVSQLGDKDEIISKHEAGVLYYETTIQELQKQLRDKTEEFDQLNAQKLERERDFFPTSPQMENTTTLPSDQNRFREKKEDEAEDYGEEEILYIKFDLSVLEADESDLLKETKQENKTLQEELELRIEKLKAQRDVMIELEDGKIVAEKRLQEKSEEMIRFHQMLKHKEHQFKQWREKIDDLERYSRELEVKLARTEASLKIALHKYNESFHRLKVLSSQREGIDTVQTKEQEMQELNMNEKISQLTKQKHKLEAQLDQAIKKVKSTAGKINYLENFIYQQKEELSSKESILYKMQQQNEDQKQLLKSTELRLRQVSVTKVKDWQRKFEKQEKEKKIMEEMVRSAKIEQQFKDAEIKKMEKKIKRLEKLVDQRVQAERSDRTEGVSTSPSRRSSEHTRSNQRLKKINQVQENLETTNTLQKFQKVSSHQSLPQISRTPSTVKALKGKGSTERYLARQYETPPVKKTFNMLASSPHHQKRLLPSSMHRQIFKRVNTFSKGGQRMITESSTPSPVNDREESPDSVGRGGSLGKGQDDTISKFSEIRAARLKKAADSPFWRQQVDNQYQDYLSSIGRQNSKNSSMGLRKVLFQPGNQDTTPLIYNHNFFERFKPS